MPGAAVRSHWLTEWIQEPAPPSTAILGGIRRLQRGEIYSKIYPTLVIIGSSQTVSTTLIQLIYVSFKETIELVQMIESSSKWSEPLQTSGFDFTESAKFDNLNGINAEDASARKSVDIIETSHFKKLTRLDRQVQSIKAALKLMKLREALRSLSEEDNET